MPTIRTDPRISINSMAEYLGATASRRQRIVEEQKRPPTFRVNWYQFAQDTITQFIVAGEVYSTPNTSTRRIQDVSAACREIVLM